METADIDIEKLNLHSMQNKSNKGGVLTDADDHIAVTNKCNLINLV